VQSNDLIGHLYDILQYHDTVTYLKSVVDDDKDGETVLLGTADHECGGLSLVRSCHSYPDWNLLNIL
jgi:alkaline phosphatase